MSLSGIVKNILDVPHVISHWKEDVDALVGHYLVLIGNLAHDHLHHLTIAAADDLESMEVVSELNKACCIINMMLDMNLEDLPQFPNAMNHLMFALTNLSASQLFKPEAARIILHFLERVGESPAVLFQELKVVEDEVLNPFYNHLCAVISNCCSSELGENSPRKDRRFVQTTITFVLSVIDKGWARTQSGFAALHKLVRKSPENCKILLEHGGCRVLLRS